jgi:hypothetical protein
MSSGTKITPYVYSGITYLRHDELYVLSGKTEKTKKLILQSQ